MQELTHGFFHGLKKQKFISGVADSEEPAIAQPSGSENNVVSCEIAQIPTPDPSVKSDEVEETTNNEQTKVLKPVLGKVKAKKLLMAFFKQQNKVQNTQNNVHPNNVLKINKSKDGASLVDGGKKTKLGNALESKDKKIIKKVKKRPGT